MRSIVTVLIAAWVGCGTAFAQEQTVGGRRIEIAGFPGGVIVFGRNADDDGPNFGDYALGASLSVNMNRWVGFEGEFGGGVGYRQDVTFNSATVADQKTPHMLVYSGNVVVHLVGKDRRLAPYVTGGAGGLTLLSAPEVANLGVTRDETYFTGNLGGGVKWFPLAHLGLRGDGRLIVIKNKDDAPLLFGQDDNRYGFRVYGGVVLTY